MRIDIGPNQALTPPPQPTSAANPPMTPAPHQRTRLLAGLGLLVLAALITSGIAPYDRATWLMEVAPC